MRYTFCTIDNGAGSAWMRAGMVSIFMQAEKKRSARWIYGEDNILKSLETATKDDCYIFLKKFYSEKTVSLAKEKCGLLILDISDDFSDHNQDLWIQSADAVMHDTDSHARYLRDLGYAKTLKVSHMHSNFDNQFRQLKKNFSSIKTVGYLGTPQQLHNTEEIIGIVKKQNLNWYQENPNLHNNAYHTTQLDLQIINIQHEEKLKYKPFSKLVNAFSFGIPCLFSPYESYQALVKDTENLEWLCCKSLDEFSLKLEKLINDEDFLQKIKEECFQISQKYHVSKYENCYRTLFELAETKQ